MKRTKPGVIPAEEWNSLTQEEKKRRMMEGRKRAMEHPKLFLQTTHCTNRIVHGRDNSCQPDTFADVGQKLASIFTFDIQHLFLQAIDNNIANFKPRWCTLRRHGKVSHVLVVAVPGMTRDTFTQNANCFPRLIENFDLRVELVPSALYKWSFLEEFFHMPLSKTSIEKCAAPLSAGVNDTILPRGLEESKKSYDVKSGPTDDVAHWRSGQNATWYPPDAPDLKPVTSSKDAFPRTKLLLNVDQQIKEGYIMPGEEHKYEFVMTRKKYEPVTDSSPIFSIDCEMVRTCDDPQELARVSVVNEDLECIFDCLVKPHSKIISYLSEYSGMTAALLDPVTTRLEDVQRHLKKLIPRDAILCGQSLCHDLKALRMYHPYVIDTSVIYKVNQYRDKSKLKALAYVFLGKKIQGHGGHCSIEDARAAMQLTLLKLRSGLWFGDTRFPQFKGLSEHNLSTEHEAALRLRCLHRTGKVQSIFQHIKHKSSKPRPVAIVDKESNAEHYEPHSTYIDRLIYAATDKELTRHASETMLEHFVTFVHMNDHPDDDMNTSSTADDDTKTRKQLIKLDSHLNTLHEAAADRALIMVVFTGGCGGADTPLPGMCFVKTKET